MPTHSQSLPSTADEYASDWWSDLIGGFTYYRSGGYDLSSEGGSRPADAPRSDDEDVGGGEDDDE